MKLILLLFCVNVLAELSEPRVLVHPYGAPINILLGNESIVANFEAILLHPEVRNRKVVVFTLSDRVRETSLFSNYCLRFMYANYKSINFMDNTLMNKTNWLGDPNEPLRGFPSISSKNKTEIYLWDDVFLHTNELGDEIAIVLMHKSFGFLTSSTDSLRMFALSTLISSVSFYNLKEKDREHPHDFELVIDLNEYIREECNGTTSIQSIYYFVDDWPIFDQQNDKSEFKSKLSINVKYGRLSSMKPEIKNEMITMIESLLSAGNLKMKKINNVDVSGFELSEYIKMYLHSLESDRSPLTVDKQLNISIHSCLENFVARKKKTDDIKNIGEIKLLKQQLDKKDLEILSMEKQFITVKQQLTTFEELHSVLMTEFYEVKDSEMECEDKLMESVSILKRIKNEFMENPLKESKNKNQNLMN